MHNNFTPALKKLSSNSIAISKFLLLLIPILVITSGLMLSPVNRCSILNLAIFFYNIIICILLKKKTKKNYKKISLISVNGTSARLKDKIYEILRVKHCRNMRLIHVLNASL